MSEPIIIEIPSPTCRARFVLVHVGQCSGATCGIPRDATPDDLARGGYVAEAESIAGNVLDFVSHTFDPGIGSPQDAWVRVLYEYGAVITRAEKAERERDDAVAAHRSALAEQTARADTNFRAALKVQGDMTDLRVALSAAESANAEGHELLAAETARAEKAEGLLIQRETELRLAREDGAAVERQMREARSAADASFVRANQAEAAMAKRSAQVARLTAALHGLVAADTARGGDCPSCGVDDSALCLPGCAVNEALAALGEP